MNNLKSKSAKIFYICHDNVCKARLYKSDKYKKS